jgi:phospholipase C
MVERKKQERSKMTRGAMPSNQEWRLLRAGLSRRQFLGGALATGLGSSLTSHASRIIDQAASFDPMGTGSLNDIEHFVFVMQENRSFDHYFGTYSTTRGFSDPYVPQQVVNGTRSSIFNQYGYEPGRSLLRTWASGVSVSAPPVDQPRLGALAQGRPTRRSDLHQRKAGEQHAAAAIRFWRRVQLGGGVGSVSS